VAGDSWDPDQYGRFHAERTQPFLDLLALVRPRPGMRVVDLGCGTGELTRRLHHELEAVDTVGIERSAAMLARSTAFAAEGLRFEAGDIAHFAARGAYDLVFSNAALQWVPGHEALFVRLTEALADDGQLAVQMPANYDHPSHAVAAEVAEEPLFRGALGAPDPLTPPVLEPEAYAMLLARLGYRAQHVRLQVYGHWLGSREDVVEWVKGTLLTAPRERLPPPLYDEYLARYRARLLPRLEDARPYFLPFKRILLWAQR
jgi:trans-aconitate 2-methyltransferase